jgi:hypothetical protein
MLNKTDYIEKICEELSKKYSKNFFTISKKKDLDFLLLYWRHFSDFQNAYSFCSLISRISLSNSDYRKTDILEKSKLLKIDTELSELRSIKEIINDFFNDVFSRDITDFQKYRILHKACFLFPRILPAICEFRKFDLIKKLNSKNSSINLYCRNKGTIPKFRRKANEDKLFGKDTENHLNYHFSNYNKSLITLDADFKGINVHKKGLGSHILRNFTKYPKMLLKSIQKGVKDEFPYIDENDQLILVYDVAKGLKVVDDKLDISESNKESVEYTDGMARYLTLRERKKRKIIGLLKEGKEEEKEI